MIEQATFDTQFAQLTDAIKLQHALHDQLSDLADEAWRSKGDAEFRLREMVRLVRERAPHICMPQDINEWVKL